MRALTGLGLNRSDRVHKKNPVLNSNGACLTTSNETTTFFHPDYTVGSGLTGSTRNWLAGLAAMRCPTAGRDLTVVSPCPEGYSI